jgi:hypothetical protein
MHRMARSSSLMTMLAMRLCLIYQIIITIGISLTIIIIIISIIIIIILLILIIVVVMIMSVPSKCAPSTSFESCDTGCRRISPALLNADLLREATLETVRCDSAIAGAVVLGCRLAEDVHLLLMNILRSSSTNPRHGHGWTVPTHEQMST